MLFLTAYSKSLEMYSLFIDGHIPGHLVVVLVNGRHLKMTYLLLYAALISVIRAYDYDYDNFQKCRTESDEYTDEMYLECYCEDRENITLHPIYDSEITRITIKGCGAVRVPFSALNNLQLQELEFIDLNKLTILPFALSSVHGVSVLKIADVADLEIIQHGFVGVHNIDRLIISNVTVNTLTKEAFNSVTNVNMFVVEDCTFREVQQLAFSLHNVTNLMINNSEFYFLQDYSFLIHNSEKVIFEHCLFHQTENGSFILSFVDSVYFKSCHFKDIATTAFHSNVLSNFSITDSIIEDLQPEAFGNLVIQDKITFKNNSVSITYETSLDPLLTPYYNLSVDYCCNSFTCDCNIFWLWEMKNSDENNILENSKCIGDSTQTLDLYKPIMDSYNNCMTLELKSSQTMQFFDVSKPVISFGSSLIFSIRTLITTFVMIKLLS
ncbi:uncharacterized protein CDAR_263741 [Caerostris darwini]|uniref:Right handed beta helix domain-containing protein n=1 Tax=Caerostris darwini TaxID=1538125 RepID=A0AAV4RWH2_9ARAC|nr:uncharacterized protein CDAR_263741 [Caerostris darwini]